MTYPKFPHFKEIAIEDRDFIGGEFLEYGPDTSEMTFTNLFIWRKRYALKWSVLDGSVIFLAEPEGEEPYFLQPVGMDDRRETVLKALRWLKAERGAARPSIKRADARLLSEIKDDGRFSFESTREQYDYVYLSEDLVNLGGRRYHSKRNHIARFEASGRHEYFRMGPEHSEAAMELAKKWCAEHRCKDDMNLIGESDAIAEALSNFDALGLKGGVVIGDGGIEAFTLGELLNGDTAVIHIEKADMHLEGVYPAINRMFCEHEWKSATYVNREQDLGDEGLRKAKMSYHPDHFAEKFEIFLQ